MAGSLLALRRFIRAGYHSSSVVGTRDNFQLNTTLERSRLFVDRCDHLIVSVLVFLILFSPLAYGGVDPWAYQLIRVGVLIMLSAFLLRAAYSRDFSFLSPAFKVPAFLFLVLLSIQTIPLPIWLREVLSPVPLNHSLLVPPIAEYGQKPIESNWTQISLYPPATWEAFIDFSTFLVLVWLVLNAIRQKDRQRMVLFSIVGIGSFQALYGLFEYLSGRQGIFFVPKMYYREDVTGTYINHNHFAGLMELAIPIVIALLWTTLPEQGHLSGLFSTKGTKKPVSKILALAGLLSVMLVSLILSHSRGGLFSIGTALMVLAFFLFQHRRAKINRLTTLVLAVLVLVVIFLSGELISRFSYSFRDAPERIGVWKDATNIVKDFPLWGTGFGTFKHVLPNYRQKVDILMVDGVPRQASWDFVHNDYLQLLVECGFLGLILASWGIVLWFRQFLVGLETVPNNEDRIIRYGLGCSVIALLIHSFMDFNLHLPANALISTVCLILATCYGSRAVSQGHSIDQDKAVDALHKEAVQNY